MYCDSLLMLFALKCVSPKDVRFWILLKRGALNESDDTAESHQCIWGRKSSIYEKCAFCKSGWKKKYLIVWTVCSAQSLMLICACMKPFSGIETSRWGICRKYQGSFWTVDIKKNLPMLVKHNRLLKNNPELNIEVTQLSWELDVFDL